MNVENIEYFKVTPKLGYEWELKYYINGEFKKSIDGQPSQPAIVKKKGTGYTDVYLSYKHSIAPSEENRNFFYVEEIKTIHSLQENEYICVTDKIENSDRCELYIEQDGGHGLVWEKTVSINSCIPNSKYIYRMGDRDNYEIITDSGYSTIKFYSPSLSSIHVDDFSEDKETLGWPIIKMTEFQEVQTTINKCPNNDLVLFWDAGKYTVSSDLLLDNRKIYFSGNNKAIFNITNQDITFSFKNNARLTIDGFTIQGNYVINLQRQEGDLSNNYIKLRNSTITLGDYFYINSLCPELKYVKHTGRQLRIYECYDIKISQCVLQSCDIQECYKANIKNNLLKSYFSFSEIYSIKETGVFTNNIIEGVFYIVNSLNKTLFIKNFFLNNGRPGDDKTSNIFRKNINYYYNT